MIFNLIWFACSAIGIYLLIGAMLALVYFTPKKIDESVEKLRETIKEDLKTKIEDDAYRSQLSCSIDSDFGRLLIVFSIFVSYITFWVVSFFKGELEELL